MPILEYRCKDCYHQFEAIVLGSHVPVCPECQSTQLDRQLSVFAVGKQRDKVGAAAPMGACGACGDPRGPGACTMD